MMHKVKKLFLKLSCKNNGLKVRSFEFYSPFLIMAYVYNLSKPRGEKTLWEINVK